MADFAMLMEGAMVHFERLVLNDVYREMLEKRSTKVIQDRGLDVREGLKLRS